MAEPAVNAPESKTLSRCCAQHPDWPTLAEHLLEEYAELAVADVVREIGRAREAVENMLLDERDALTTGESIARHQLSLRAGRIVENVRLTPHPHLRTPR